MNYPVEIKSLDARDNNENVLRILTGTGSQIGDLFLQTVSKTNGLVHNPGTVILIDSGLYSNPDPLYSKVKDVWNAAFEKTKQELFEKPGQLPESLFAFNKENIITFWPSQEVLAFEHMRMDFIQNAHGFVGIRTGYTNEDVSNQNGVVWLAGPDNNEHAHAVGVNRYQARAEIFGDLFERVKNEEVANVLNPFLKAAVR